MTWDSMSVIEKSFDSKKNMKKWVTGVIFLPFLQFFGCPFLMGWEIGLGVRQLVDFFLRGGEVVGLHSQF